MAFVKANLTGDKLTVDLDVTEKQLVQWTKDKQGVLHEVGEVLTQFLKDRWKMEAGERLISVVSADQAVLQGILYRADQGLKESRKPVKEDVPIDEILPADEKVKGKA